MKPKSFILISGILLIAIFSLFIVSAETLVFSDNFSTDPNIYGGKWIIERAFNISLADAGIFSPGQFQLTNNLTDFTGIAMFANYKLTSKNWKAEFDFKQDSKSDGIAFMFYKNEDYPGQGVGVGGTLGMFGRGPTLEGAGPHYCTAGYGIGFDNFNNGELDGVNVNNTLYFTTMGQGFDNFTYSSPVHEDRVADNQWHHATILFDNGNIKVKIDNDSAYKIDTTQNIDYTNTGVGISAASAVGGKKYIKNFALYDLEIGAPNSVTNLTLVSATNKTLTWSWTNPAVNFNGTIISVSGTSIVNLRLNNAANSYTALNLNPNTDYTITIHTIGLNGVINDTDVSNTGTTLANPTTSSHHGAGTTTHIFYSSNEEPVTVEPIIHGQSIGNLTSTDLTTSNKFSGNYWIFIFFLGLLILLLLILLVLALISRRR